MIIVPAAAINSSDTSNDTPVKRMPNNGSTKNVNNNLIHNQMNADACHSLIDRPCAISRTIASTTTSITAIGHMSDNSINSGGGASRTEMTDGSVGLKAFNGNACNRGFDSAKTVSNSNELSRNGNATNANNAIKNLDGMNANNNIDSSQHQIEVNNVFGVNANKFDHFAVAGNYHAITAAASTPVEYDCNRANNQASMIQQNPSKQQYDQHHQQAIRQQQQTAYQMLQMNNALYASNGPADGNENVILTTLTSGASPNSGGIGCATAAAAATTPASQTSTNSGGNNNTIVANKYNQNFILARSMELHDIQEELYALEEEETYIYDPFVVRRSGTGKCWNSLPVHKYANYHGSIIVEDASTSYANNNNCSAASLLTGSNRNPFLNAVCAQSATAITPPSSASSTSSLSTTMSTFFIQPNNDNRSNHSDTMAVNNTIISSSPSMTFSKVNNNTGTCLAYATTATPATAGTNIFAALRHECTADDEYGTGDGMGIDDNDHLQQQLLNIAEHPNEDIRGYDATVHSHSEPITPEAMHTLQLFFRQHGAEYIQEFLQVINISFSASRADVDISVAFVQSV